MQLNNLTTVSCIEESVSKQESDPSIIDSQFKNTNQSVSQFKKNLNFGKEIVDIKKMLTTRKRTTH